MKLLLARHGNTFEAGETPRIVGCNEDLQLTVEGEAQAVRLAEYLKENRLLPCSITSGVLRRTRRTAEIVASTLGLPAPVTDSRLTELDYGDWSGLTTDEVRSRFGDAEVQEWDRSGIMPKGRGWAPSTDELLAHIMNFAAGLDPECPGQTALAITSNGVLRFFSRLVPGLFEDLATQGKLKVGTGNLCGLEQGDTWRLLFWNVKP